MKTRFTLKLTFIILLSFGALAAQATSSPAKYKTKGLDIEILSYGGSLGGLYSFHPKPSISIDLEADWSLVEASDTFSYYTYYGQPVTVNDHNLSFIKFLVGTSWFPFLESMHSSMQFGGFVSGGPLLSLNTADDEEFFTRWQDVETDLIPMIRAGVVVKVISGKGSFYTFKLGYDYAEFDKVIDTRQIYRGPFFQVCMEFIHQ